MDDLIVYLFGNLINNIVDYLIHNLFCNLIGYRSDNLFNNLFQNLFQYYQYYSQYIVAKNCNNHKSVSYPLDVTVNSFICKIIHILLKNLSNMTNNIMTNFIYNIINNIMKDFTKNLFGNIITNINNTNTYLINNTYSQSYEGSY